MTDPRRHPANSRVAAAHLRGAVDAPQFTDGAPRRIAVPVADLLRTPNGSRDRQLVLGEAVTCFETHDGWCFVQAARDGYVGYLAVDQLGDPEPSTHSVTARSTHLYPAADFKAREIAALSFGSRLAVRAIGERFAEIEQGFVPAAHLTALTDSPKDPVAVAETFLGAPYLWGGNTGFGIDCSGLIQMACLACDILCPGDSDMQEAELGQPLPDNRPLRRGDLLFWRGHVAWVADPGTLLHANAFHMAVAYEHLQNAISRIELQGDGPVTMRKRLKGPT